MKSIIIYESIYHNNTQKLVESMSQQLNCKAIRPKNVEMNTLKKYDLIGFGSGIYLFKHHKNILNLADDLPQLNGQDVFIFATSGFKKISVIHNFRQPLAKKLIEKGGKIKGEFFCRGFDNFGPLKLFGGINKGRPNQNDLKKAKAFVNELNK